MINKLKFEYYSVAEVFQLLSEDYDITRAELIKYIQLGKLQTNVRVNGTWNTITQVSNKKLTQPIELVSYPASGFITYSQNNVKVHSAIAVNLENNHTIINLKSSDFFDEYNLYDGQDISIQKPDKQVCLSDLVMSFKSIFKLPYQLYDETLIDDNKLFIDFSSNELDYHKISDVIPIFVINRPVFPLVKEDVDELKLACLDAENEFGMKVSLIIIDTLARCLGSADENLAKDMGAFIAGCDKLKGDTDASILIVHHTGKDESRGARGSSALTASLDCEFFISRDGKNSNNQSLVVECTKMKDMEPPSRKAYVLKNIELYYDQEKELVSSLTVVDEPYEPKTQQLPIELKGINNLTKNHVILFETIKQQLNENQPCTKNSIKLALKNQGIKNIEGGYYKWLEKLVKEDIVTISIIDNQSIELIK